MTLKTKKVNDPLIKLEYKRDRTIALGMANYQITETKSNSFVIGLGYKITEVPNPFGRKKGSKLPVGSIIEKASNPSLLCVCGSPSSRKESYAQAMPVS